MNEVTELKYVWWFNNKWITTQHKHQFHASIQSLKRRTNDERTEVKRLIMQMIKMVFEAPLTPRTLFYATLHTALDEQQADVT